MGAGHLCFLFPCICVHFRLFSNTRRAASFVIPHSPLLIPHLPRPSAGGGAGVHSCAPPTSEERAVGATAGSSGTETLGTWTASPQVAAKNDSPTPSLGRRAASC